MTTIYILSLGFLIGLKHALEADHVAAVASLASKASSVKEGLMLGATWGLGHTVTLFLIGSTVLFFDTLIPEHVAQILEFLVGCMLVFMGGSLIKEFVGKRMHFHLHHHSDGVTHLHFHSHAHEKIDHKTNPHNHKHPAKISVKALLVGMMHGMAGSAALILLALESASSIKVGLAYILLFGMGSVLGMSLLSTIMVIPFRHSEKSANHAFHSMQAFIGFGTLFLGLTIMYKTSGSQGFFL